MKIKKVERKEKEKDSGNVNQKLREREICGKVERHVYK